MTPYRRDGEVRARAGQGAVAACSSTARHRSYARVALPLAAYLLGGGRVEVGGRPLSGGAGARGHRAWSGLVPIGKLEDE